MISPGGTFTRLLTELDEPTLLHWIEKAGREKAPQERLDLDAQGRAETLQSLVNYTDLWTAWIVSHEVVELAVVTGRIRLACEGQLATAGKLTSGSSLKRPTLSSVM